MEKKPKNPRAFAKPQSAGLYGDAQQGMTLRDYFAAAALQGMLSNPKVYRYGGGDNMRIDSVDDTDFLVQDAYGYADGMLAERERGQS